MTLDLKRLESAVAVAEEGNLSRAAMRLHLSQPALSRRIQELERDLDFALFEPMGRGIRLTGEGQAFLAKCRDLLAHSQAIEDESRTFASGLGGVLRVGASAQILENMFPEFLRRYRARFAQVEVELVEDNQTNLLLLLERGEIHFTVSALPQNDRIESRALAPALVLAAVARNHPLKGAGQIEVKDLTDAPMLLVNKGFKARQVFDATCQIAHVEPRVVLESAAPQTVLALAGAGLGIAIFPSNTPVDRRRLHVVPLVHDGAPLEMQLAINWVHGRHLPSYANGFIELMTNVAKEKFTSEFHSNGQKRRTQ